MSTYLGFASLDDVWDWSQQGHTVYYHAPLDHNPRKVTLKRFKNGKLRVRVLAGTLNFTADAGHLDRFKRRPAFTLSDDGTMDTVVECSECGEELRYNFSGEPGDGEVTTDEGWDKAYNAFVAWVIEDASEEHTCGSDAGEV